MTHGDTSLQVRYGAEMVFSSSALNITDEDIDAIIQKGERDTAALNNKLKVGGRYVILHLFFSSYCIAWQRLTVQESATPRR